jgi:methylase of polypeptide subunit release factors
VPAAAEVLKPGGVLVVEIAPALDRAVAGLLEAAGFEGIEVRPDLAARPRAVLGRRPLGARSRVE